MTSIERRHPRVYYSAKNKVKIDHLVTYKSSVYLRHHDNKPTDFTAERSNGNVPNKSIKDHYDQIIKMYHNNEFEKIMDLLVGSKSCHAVSDRADTEYCISVLSHYCIIFNDLELFKIIFQQNKSDNDSIRKCNLSLAQHIDPVPFLNILFENNVKMDTNIVLYAIMYNNTKFISYLISIDYDITEGWIRYYDSLKFHFEKLCSISMLKVLFGTNIDILSNLYILMFAAIQMRDFGIIEFITETYPNHDLNKYKYLNECCEAHNKDALVYLLKNGANVNMIDQNSVSNTHVKIVEILINHNYKVTKTSLKDLLIKNFVFDLNNVIFLIKNGAEIQWIFDNEEEQKDKISIKSWHSLNSNLEYVITQGYINYIKFLVENYLTLLKPELNRLFVIACANGRNNIASYLFDLGAELNNMALTCAVFFGHFDTVVMLLKLGINLNSNSIKGNLFTVAFIGYETQGNISKIYDDLISNDTIFRNDDYNYGDKNEYVAIIKLLISHNVPIDDSYVFKKFTVTLYDVEIFIYFINNGMDINMKFGVNNDRSFLSIAIGATTVNLDVIEFLLQCGIDTKIMNTIKTPAISIINSNEQLKNLLLKYGVDV